MSQDDINSFDDCSEEGRAAIQETLYLLNIPGMRESIKDGMNTPIDECATALDWG